jgi:ATP-dependent DNA helicase RecG
LIRKEIPEIPYDALREAILNAVIHRDYHVEGAFSTVEIYRNRVEITDPGGLAPGMKIEDLGKYSKRRNRLIADLFHRIGEVERVGSGISRMKGAMRKAGLQEPEFDIGSFFNIQFERGGSKETSEGLNEGLNEGLKTMLKQIAKCPGIKAIQISKDLHRPISTVDRQIRNLKEMNLIKRHGSKKTGGYYAIER